MNAETLACAIIGHLVADYLLQNDWMALNKKKDSFPCLVHCLIWTLCVSAFAGWYTTHDGWNIVLARFILLVSHFIQDRTQIVRFWMTRINRQPKFVEPPMAPWSIIVVDNVWHIVTIWVVWRFIV